MSSFSLSKNQSFLNEDRNKNDKDFQLKWQRGDLIGKGAFGFVYEAMLLERVAS